MKITDEMVDYVAELSRLELEPAERHSIANELSIMVDYMDSMSQLDTSKIEAMSHVLDVKNVLREDVVKPSADRDLLLSQAPQRDEESFIVPKTVE